MELYTAKQAKQRLGLRVDSSLHHLVNKGMIRRVIPPGREYGYYSKEDVDKLAQARQEFSEQNRIAV